MRRAVDRSYGSTLHDAIVEGLDASFAAWSEQNEDGAGYVEGLRPGMARRLADV